MDFKKKDARGHIPLTAAAAEGDVTHAAQEGHLALVRLLMAARSGQRVHQQVS